MKMRPTIVCLCGSTKFKDAFMQANKEETLSGKIVLSVGFFGHSDAEGPTDEQKAALDELHLRKIDFADEVLVLNVGGYIGSSTQREIAYTIYMGRKMRFLDEDLGEAYLKAKSHEIAQLIAKF